MSALVACGDAVVGATPTTTTAVACSLVGPAVTPASVNIKVGDTLRFKATLGGGGACGPVLSFFWRSSNPTLATIDSASGLLTALKAGSVTAIAKAIGDTVVQGAAAVSITP